MKVKRLPVDTGRSGWLEVLETEETCVKLNSNISCDHLVIGAGFAGLSAARHLSKLDPGSGIVMLEAARVSEGPAGRNSGFMIDLPHELSSADYAGTEQNDLNQIQLNRRAIEFAADAVAEYGMPDETFQRIGKVNGAATSHADKFNQDYAKHLEALGEAYELLDRERMKELTGSDFYSSGVYSPGTCLLQPALYTRGVANGLANSVSIFEESPVVELSRSNHSWMAKTPSGSVSAKNVILATNGHIESFGHFERRVFHVILYASMTRSLTKEEAGETGVDNWGITPSDPVATTMRKHSGAGGIRIITRNQMTYAPTMQVDGDQVSRMGMRHQASFAKRYPGLQHVEQEYAWAGRLCLSRNSAPAFGKLDKGLFSACCQNGLGTTKGTLSGMAAAEFVVEGKTELVQTHLDAGTPSKLPPFPLDVVGANAILGMKEFSARNEL